MAKESKVVTAIGVSAAAHKGGRILGERVAQAMRDAILECNAEGISTEEKNAHVIRSRMMAAKQRVLDEFGSQQG